VRSCEKIIQSVRATLCGRPVQNPADFSWPYSEVHPRELYNLFGKFVSCCGGRPHRAARTIRWITEREAEIERNEQVIT
jgi:hypothetical protein